MLLTLSLESPLAAPADASNAVADDANAATLGQALFFDPDFSGRLLDSDNGTAQNMEGFVHKSVGHQGESGRVSCASCHVPTDVFGDTRTVHQQVSLAAGRSKPRAPKIYEIYDALGGLVQEVGLGKVSPADAAKMGQEAMLAICEKCLLD